MDGAQRLVWDTGINVWMWKKGEKMKLQLMFLLMDFLMLFACGYLWLKYGFVRALVITKS